jgi:hypothetical protein
VCGDNAAAGTAFDKERLMSLQGPRIRLIALAALLTVLVAAAQGQQGAPGGKGKKTDLFNKEETSSGSGLLVIPLKHIAASDVAQQLRVLFGDEAVKCIPVRENALAISALPVSAEAVKEYIAAIDVEGQNAPTGQRLQIVPLKAAGADSDLQKILGLFGTVSSAVDRQRKAVVLSGPERDVQELVKLLRQLDELHAAKPSEDKPLAQNFRVRVVWLANFPGQKEVAKAAPQIPPDLKDVQNELAQMGIGDLRLVSQSMVSTSGHEFEAEGAPPEMFTGSPGNARISVKGTLHTQGREEGQDRIRVHLSLNVSDQDEPKSKFCQLTTDITTTSGHLVVLGVTPSMRATSVFVVQIVAK